MVSLRHLGYVGPGWNEDGLQGLSQESARGPPRSGQIEGEALLFGFGFSFAVFSGHRVSVALLLRPLLLLDAELRSDLRKTQGGVFLGVEEIFFLQLLDPLDAGQDAAFADE